MFQKIILTVFLISSFQLNHEPGTRNYNDGSNKLKLSEVRELFYRAVESESSLDSLNAYLESNYAKKDSKHRAVLLAYEGAAESLKAKYAFWPFSKLSYLETGVELMTEAVGLSPDNIEVRFLRFSVLHHVPGFLGYGDFLKTDTAELLKLLTEKKQPEIDRKLKMNIVRFVLDSGRLLPEQENKLSGTYISLNGG